MIKSLYMSHFVITVTITLIYHKIKECKVYRYFQIRIVEKWEEHIIWKQPKDQTPLLLLPSRMADCSEIALKMLYFRKSEVGFLSAGLPCCVPICEMQTALVSTSQVVVRLKGIINVKCLQLC